MIKKDQRTEDEYYVKEAQNGNQEALEYLFKKYHNLAFYIALKICHCDADAEDIVQESFIEIHRSIHKLKEPKFFKAWLNKVVFSKSTKLFRKNRDISLSDDDYLMMTQNQEERRYLLPMEEMNFNSDREVLLHFLDQLPDKLRVSLYLMYFEQMSVKEISFVLEIPEGTVKSRISTAKTELKTMIRRYERDENVKLDFHAHSLEAALTVAFLHEFGQVCPLGIAGTAFHSGYKSLSIHPAGLAALTVCILTGGIFAYGALTQSNHSSQQEETIVTSQALHTFEPVMFQGEIITTAREAYKALVTTAHCHVEIEPLDEGLQNEMKNVYRSLKKTGGIYYEILVNRHYADMFE